MSNRSPITRNANRQPIGEHHPRARLSDADVRSIRAEHRPGERGHGYDALARRWGVHRSTIRDIITYRTRYSA